MRVCDALASTTTCSIAARDIPILTRCTYMLDRYAIRFKIYKTDYSLPRAFERKRLADVRSSNIIRRRTNQRGWLSRVSSASRLAVAQYPAEMGIVLPGQVYKRTICPMWRTWQIRHNDARCYTRPRTDEDHARILDYDNSNFSQHSNISISNVKLHRSGKTR